MPFNKTIPILRILDEAKAKEFYVDFLGFKVDWANRASGALFMQVSLDECVLHWGSLDMVLVDPFGNRLIFTNASAPVLRGSSVYSQ